MMTTEISTAREQQLFNGKNFHVVIYNKTESVSGLHQHDYYEFTVVLTGRYYQEDQWQTGAAGARGFRLYPDGLAPPELLRVRGDAHP